MSTWLQRKARAFCAEEACVAVALEDMAATVSAPLRLTSVRGQQAPHITYRCECGKPAAWYLREMWNLDEIMRLKNKGTGEGKQDA